MRQSLLVCALLMVGCNSSVEAGKQAKVERQVDQGEGHTGNCPRGCAFDPDTGGLLVFLLGDKPNPAQSYDYRLNVRRHVNSLQVTGLECKDAKKPPSLSYPDGKKVALIDDKATAHLQQTVSIDVPAGFVFTLDRGSCSTLAWNMRVD